MSPYQTWHPQQHQQHLPRQQIKDGVHYQEWSQQLQPIHHSASCSCPSPHKSGPPTHTVLQIHRPDQTPASSDIVSQAMSVVNNPLDRSGPLDVSLGSAFNDSSFLKKLGGFPVTPQEKDKTPGVDDGDLNTPPAAKANEKHFSLCVL